MNKDSSIFALAFNALLGVLLLVWVALTLPWVLLGSEPPLPGTVAAFVSMCAWAGWNANYLLRVRP